MPDSDCRHRMTALHVLAHRSICVLPGAWRERIAERFLRRPGAPGPASEHVVQYLIGAARLKGGARKPPETAVIQGADHFYDRQYRQYLNAVMGAFAMTAFQALAASGGAPRGWLWLRRRKVYPALLEQIAGAPPIVVIDRQTVAAPILLPEPQDLKESAEIMRWLAGGAMPERFRRIVAGEEVRCAELKVIARERSADGAVLELVDAAIASKRLALLALHPHDPDAMGLHISLFGVEALQPDRLERDYGLASTELDPHRKAARQAGGMLVFCVGGTEEVFTQCSQNLFVKRPSTEPARQRPAMPDAWHPGLPLERLLESQFETIQVTVSASGLPGASPRNGDVGKAAFVGRRRGRLFVLIPYHPGNSIHGHAAKLWSNPYGAVVISDDHRALSRVVASGPCRFIGHERLKRDFPSIAARCAAHRVCQKMRAPDPEYWFLQEVAELVQQREPLAANALDRVRPACSIAAGGEAHHGKKPAYFAADLVQSYDQELQHEREAAGRPVCPAGVDHRQWLEKVREALSARQKHLQSALDASNQMTQDLPMAK
ncbi:hypothetical protein [Methylocapsa aurea]|uniref:hypothetical protein n=1 Tax=Methylocapsa aurea TaxID=663610 RepID=UPI0012EBC966|nr:hypothetical protein [Methylocapsa aurea]